jgi:hypothetical protein
MRNLQVSLTIVFCIILLSGCKQSNNTQSSNNNVSTDNRTEIKWIGQWYGEGKKETLIKEIASDFSFQNQNYVVKLEFPHEILKMDIKRMSILLIIMR